MGDAPARRAGRPGYERVPGTQVADSSTALAIGELAKVADGWGMAWLYSAPEHAATSETGARQAMRHAAEVARHIEDATEGSLPHDPAFRERMAHLAALDRMARYFATDARAWAQKAWGNPSGVFPFVVEARALGSRMWKGCGQFPCRREALACARKVAAEGGSEIAVYEAGETRLRIAATGREQGDFAGLEGG